MCDAWVTYTVEIDEIAGDWIETKDMLPDS